jgi:hypothetical protein
VWRKTKKQFPVFVEDVRRSAVHAGPKPDGGGGKRFVLDASTKESILATLVPCGLEPVVLSKAKATDVMQGGVEALMGHGVEVAFDVGGRAVWEHGEVINRNGCR